MPDCVIIFISRTRTPCTFNCFPTNHDFYLSPIYFSQSAAHAAQVYQVTRSGHEHCDVTEGVLLDITPLVVDGRKLVTLYDKDLTEGVNLLIGKSTSMQTRLSYTLLKNL